MSNQNYENLGIDLFEKGKQEGVERGRFQERLEIVVRLLEKKYEFVTPGIKQYLSTQTPEVLDICIERFFSEMILP